MKNVRQIVAALLAPHIRGHYIVRIYDARTGSYCNVREVKSDKLENVVTIVIRRERLFNNTDMEIKK